MSYKISVTTRVSVTADTAEEVGEIYRQAVGSTPPRALPQANEAWKVAPEELQPQSAALPTPEDEQPRPDDEPGPQEAPSDNSEDDHRRLQGGQQGGHLTFQEAINVYLTATAAAGRSSETIELYRQVLQACMGEVGVGINLSSIDEAIIGEYLAGLRGRGLSPGYLHTIGRILKTFFNWQVRRHNIETSPMAGIELHIPRWKPVPPFSDDEIYRLLRATTGPMERAMVTLLLDTGMRASEFTGLKLAQVDLEQSLIRVNGKGGKARTLALNDRPRRALEAYLASRPQQDGLIWPEGWDRKKLAYLMVLLGKRAGVAKVHPHRFRHTFASRFLQQTGDAMALQALLGHSSLTMVQHYIRAAQGDIAVEVHKQHSPLDALGF